MADDLEPFVRVSNVPRGTMTPSIPNTGDILVDNFVDNSEFLQNIWYNRALKTPKIPQILRCSTWNIGALHDRFKLRQL